MYQSAEIMYMRSITPLHVGCGSDLGVVDLPIQRERHTNYPKIESSGLKGCIREYFEDKAENIDSETTVHKLFGYDRDSKSNNKTAIDNLFKDNYQYAGAVGFSDGRILLFPVKSVKGIFAWVTCPSVLNKWLDEARLCGNENKSTYNTVKANLKCPGENKVLCSSNKLLFNENDEKGRIYLEEYEFEAAIDGKVKDIAVKLSEILGVKDIDDKLVIVDDNAFTDFVTMSTEVITRTKIDDATGTVVSGALFTEEYLPSETVMYSMVMFSPTFLPDAKLGNLNDTEVKNEFFNVMSRDGSVLQLGAGATIGKGITEVKWEKKEEKKNES